MGPCLAQDSGWGPDLANKTRDTQVDVNLRRAGTTLKWERVPCAARLREPRAEGGRPGGWKVHSSCCLSWWGSIRDTKLTA